MDNKKTKQKAKPKAKEKKYQSAIDEFGSHVEKLATKTAESIKKVFDKTSITRNTVLTIRISEESNKRLRMLVDAGLFKSRSESAAFLIQEGVKSQEALFEKITSKLEKIDKIREELKGIIAKEMKPQETKNKKEAKK